MILVYLACTELYKWVKRIIARKHPKAAATHSDSDKTLKIENTIPV
jgi:hypothetical protein